MRPQFVVRFLRMSCRNQSLIFNQHRMSSFKIYTKTGDKGTSALYTGDRLDKNNKIFYCLGSLDEINANLGLAREHCLAIEDPQIHE